jgi:hypothetical protein
MTDDLPRHSESITIARPPQDVYELVSDITRMGEWSPVCKACWWDEGAGPTVGAWFTGRNEMPEYSWETRCEVVAADPGREFAFIVNGAATPYTRWGFSMEPVDGGTKLTESWQPFPGIVERFASMSDDGGAAMLEGRKQTAEEGIAATLAAIKATAERS